MLCYTVIFVCYIQPYDNFEKGVLKGDSKWSFLVPFYLFVRASPIAIGNQLALLSVRKFILRTFFMVCNASYIKYFNLQTAKTDLLFQQTKALMILPYMTLAEHIHKN